MMNRFARFKTFSMLFGIVYSVFFYFNWSSFQYYPALQKFSRLPLPISDAGPAILWYAWLAAAFVISLVASLLIPRKWAEKIPPGWVWMAPFALVLVILYYEKHWFIR